MRNYDNKLLQYIQPTGHDDNFKTVDLRPIQVSSTATFSSPTKMQMTININVWSYYIIMNINGISLLRCM